MYLVSNNILVPGLSATEKVVRWLRGGENMQVLERLMSKKGPTFESFAESSFRHAVVAGDVPVVQALLSKYLNLNGRFYSEDLNGHAHPLVCACSFCSTPELEQMCKTCC